MERARSIFNIISPLKSNLYHAWVVISPSHPNWGQNSGQVQGQIWRKLTKTPPGFYRSSVLAQLRVLFGVTYCITANISQSISIDLHFLITIPTHPIGKSCSPSHPIHMVGSAGRPSPHTGWCWGRLCCFCWPCSGWNNSLRRCWLPSRPEQIKL